MMKKRKSPRNPVEDRKKKDLIERRIRTDYPSKREIEKDPRRAMLRVASKAQKKGKVPEPPVISYRDVRALRKVLKTVLKDKKMPLLGMDSARIELMLHGSGFFLDQSSHEKRISEEEKNLALWLRRLIAADLYAQGLTPMEIGLRLGVDRGAIEKDISTIAQSQVFSEKFEDTRASIMKTMNRLEMLQRSAMMDLVEKPLPVPERAALRTEITGRELYIFKTFRDLGVFKAIEQEPSASSDQPVGIPGSVNIFVGAPQPSKPLEKMSTEERLQFMEAWMASRREAPSRPSAATDADYMEVPDEKGSTRTDDTEKESRGRKALPSPKVS